MDTTGGSGYYDSEEELNRKVDGVSDRRACLTTLDPERRSVYFKRSRANHESNSKGFV